MAVLANLARMTTVTVGTGTLTLGAAATGFLTFAQAGVIDGQSVSYAIEDGASREVGRGIYTAVGATLTRAVIKSTNANDPIALSGNAQVFVTVLAEDFDSLAKKNEGQTFTAPQRVSFTTLTYAATVTPDLNANNAFILTLTGNPVIANPTNMAAAVGQEVLLVFRGAYQPAFGSYWKFPGGEVPTFDGSLNVIGGVAVSATEISAFGGVGMA